jgi:hypothetical protein
MTVSGQNALAGDDIVTMPKAEHDALQAKIRRTEQAERERKAQAEQAKADAEKKALEEQLEAAQKAGVGKDLKQAQDENADLRMRLLKVTTDNTIRDAASTRKWSASAQRAALKMVDPSLLERDDSGTPTGDSVKAALFFNDTATTEIYTDTGGKAPGGDTDAPKSRAVSTPATPSKPGGGQVCEGYITPEEYAEAPFEARQSAEFRERAERSSKFWPNSLNHKDFAS